MIQRQRKRARPGHAPSPLHQAHAGVTTSENSQAVWAQRHNKSHWNKGEADHAPSPLQQVHAEATRMNILQRFGAQRQKQSPPDF
jgi:hypothetical protein